MQRIYSCLKVVILILAGLFIHFGMTWTAYSQDAAVKVGSGEGDAGGDVDLIVSFTNGATPVSTLQFDLVLPSELSFVSVTSGSAAVDSGKTASGNLIPDGVRILIFGLNQNAIASGPIAVVRLNISSSASAGPKPIGVSGIAASDPGGNGTAASGSGGSIEVSGAPPPPPPTDTAPPSIVGLAVSNITGNSATVSWSTDEPSDSQVEFGLTGAYGSSSPPNSNFSTIHSHSLLGLIPDTLYHFRVSSRDLSGNLGLSADLTFTTKADVSPLPAPTNVRVEQ